MNVAPKFPSFSRQNSAVDCSIWCNLLQGLSMRQPTRYNHSTPKGQGQRSQRYVVGDTNLRPNYLSHVLGFYLAATCVVKRKFPKRVKVQHFRATDKQNPESANNMPHCNKDFGRQSNVYTLVHVLHTHCNKRF